VNVDGSSTPAAAAEIKTNAGGPGMWQGAACHELANTFASYFVVVGNRAFYKRPPVAFASCVAGVFGTVCVVELVGRLFITPVSRPSFYDSDQWHTMAGSLPVDPFAARDPVVSASAAAAPADAAGGAAAAAAVPDPEEPFIIDPERAVWSSHTMDFWAAEVEVVKSPSESPSRSGKTRDTRRVPQYVQWTAVPYSHEGSDLFLKVIDWGVYDAQVLREMTAAYARLQACYDDKADRLPSSLVRASMHFGDCRVLVRAPFLTGYAALADANALTTANESSPVVIAVAKALAWLLWHDVVYTDMRAPNVMVPKSTSALRAAGLSEAVLLDYDDCKHVPGLQASLLEAPSAEAAMAIVKGHLVRFRSDADGNIDHRVIYTHRGYFEALPVVLKEMLSERIEVERASWAAEATALSAAAAAAAASVTE